MAYFESPCQRSVLIKGDAAAMPTLVTSTMADDYISPHKRHLQHMRELVRSMPPEYLSEAAGRRLLPTTFRDVHRHCVSASIGELLELEFQDDTPQWKYLNRAAAAVHWIRPLEERRKFIVSQEWYRRKNGNSSENIEEILMETNSM